MGINALCAELVDDSVLDVSVLLVSADSNGVPSSPPPFELLVSLGVDELSEELLSVPVDVLSDPESSGSGASGVDGSVVGASVVGSSAVGASVVGASVGAAGALHPDDPDEELPRLVRLLLVPPITPLVKITFRFPFSVEEVSDPVCSFSFSVARASCSSLESPIRDRSNTCLCSKTAPRPKVSRSSH